MITTLTINGQINLMPSSLPLPNVRVEIWDSGGAYGWIASTFSNAEGQFSFTLSGNIVSQGTLTIVPEYKVYVNSQLVATQTIQYGQQPVTIAIAENAMDTVITDNTGANAKVTYIQIQGQITTANGVPVSGITGATVNVNENGIDGYGNMNQVLLASVAPDINGNYTVKINAKNINNNPVIANRTLRIEVKDDGGGLIGASNDIIVTSDNINLNITTFSTYAVSSHYDNINTAIRTNLGIDPKALTIDLTINRNDFNYVSAASGHNQSDVVKLYNANQYTNGSLPAATMYAFSSSKLNEPNPIQNLKESDIRNTISNAINNGTIPTMLSSDIDTFVTNAKASQVSGTQSIPIQGESHTLGDVVSSIFTLQTDADDFFTAYNAQDFNTPEDFWNYYSNLKPSLVASAQRGLQLAAITGFQPQILNALMNNTSYNTYSVPNMATLGAQWFHDMIAAICNSDAKLYVPASIRGNATYPNDTVVWQYAQQLRTIFANAFPLTSINQNIQDSKQGPQLIPSQATRTDANTFITNNPNFDLRTNSIHDINSGAFDTTGVSDVAALATALAPFQSVLRVVGGNPDGVVSLMIGGLQSAASIVALGQTSFVNTWSAALGGVNAAANAFSRAVYINTVGTSQLINYLQMSSGTYPILAGYPVLPTFNVPPDKNADPNLSSLFGSMDYCSCSDCTSMYSPAAYLVDSLNFIRAQALPLYTELVRRRPDLPYIDLTCKNTNTSLPYIDLVNDLLEMYILQNWQHITNKPSSKSFQTNGTQQQLAAFPEHVYKDTNGNYQDFDGLNQIYGTVDTYTPFEINVWPYNLPFCYSVAETRTYLPYFGTSRLNMMRLFAPYYQSSAGVYKEVTLFTTYAESTGLTFSQANIVNNTHDFFVNSPWRFYAFIVATVSNWPDPSNSASVLPSGPWFDVLTSRIDVFLQQAQISYLELLQAMVTDFINPQVSGVRNITITAINGDDPTTCQLNQLTFNFTLPADAQTFSLKLHRFIRLYRAGNLSIYQWDTLLRSLAIANLDDSSGNTYFLVLSQASDIAKRLNIPPEYLATWWSDIDTHQYIDYQTGSLTTLPSVYDTVFNSKGIINDPSFNSIFNLYTNIPSYPYLGNTPQIAGFSNLAESDVKLILTYLGINWGDKTIMMSLTVLSKVFLFSQLTTSFGISVSDLIIVLQLSDISVNYPVASPPPSYAAMLTNLESLITNVQAIKDSGFSIDDFNYLIANIDDLGTYEPNPAAIQLFYEGLRTQLQKFPLYSSSAPGAAQLLNQLTNVIYQQFSKQFSIASARVQYMLDPAGPGTGFTQTLIAASFVSSTVPLTETVIGSCYLIYRLINKTDYIASRLKLSDSEFAFFYSTVVVFPFTSMLVTNGTLPPGVTIQSLFIRLLCLSRWIQVRNVLALPDTGLAYLLGLNYNAASPSAIKQLWLNYIMEYTNWGTMLTDLVGDQNTLSGSGSLYTSSNLLRVSFPADFEPLTTISSVTQPLYKNASLLITISEIVSWCNTIGLAPDAMFNTLIAQTYPSDSHKLVLAAKGTKNDNDWAAIAKPLRDGMRKQQRDALVWYMLGNPPSSMKLPWKTPDDLFAFFLADMQMDPCMLTSRIKMAIGSVQLFIDRAVMGLEYVNGNPANPLAVYINPATSNFIAQWTQWRKWYGIWEANREIFLYPENWMEPSLRDDKTIFFQDLEQQLLQNQVTADTAEDAILNYLLSLDEVARMEPVGTCDQVDRVTGQNITHVFSRSHADPNHYYYRRLVDDLWTPWEKLNLNIKSDQIMPIVWDNKVFLFWITFQQKKVPFDPSAPSTPDWLYSKWLFNRQNEVITDSISDSKATVQYYTSLEITINWSEYKNGAWLKPKSGKDKMLLKLNPGLDMGIWPQYVQPYKYLSFLSNNREMTMPDLAQTRLYFYPYLYDGSRKDIIADNGDGHVLSNVNLDMNNLYIMAFMQIDPNEIHENMGCVSAFRFSDGSTEPVVLRDQTLLAGIQTPSKMVMKSNKFVEYQLNLPDNTSSADLTTNMPLLIDNYSISKRTDYYFYRTQVIGPDNPGVSINIRTSSTSILSQTPNGRYTIQPKSNFTANPLENQFFFVDDVNTFFVRKVWYDANILTNQALYLPTTLTFGSAGQLAAQNYSLSPIAATGTFSVSLKLVPTSPFASTFADTTVITAPSPSPYYYFQTFYHPHIHDFISTLNSQGIDGLLSLSSQMYQDSLNFVHSYVPTSIVSGTPKVSFIHPRGISEYNGDYTNSFLGGVGLYELMVNGVTFNGFGIPFWGDATTVGTFEIYSTSIPWSGYDTLAALAASSKLLETVNIAAGSMNTTAGGMMYVNLTATHSVTAGTYIYIVFIQTAGTSVHLTYFLEDTTPPSRHPFWFGISIGSGALWESVPTFATSFMLTYLAPSYCNSIYGYPDNTVDFSLKGAYSIYNWELFFHIPMLIATSLSANQQFQDAQAWFHYIFDPTSVTDASGNIGTKQRFWKFKPFYDLTVSGSSIASVSDLLNHIHANNYDAVTQVKTWEDNPFDPFAVARVRNLAFMKNVVMKYLDNLIAWGDQLFTQDTIESINEATLLYILASNILGQRPPAVPQRATTAPKSFADLASGYIDVFGNAVVAVESYIDPNTGASLSTRSTTPGPIPTMQFFCLPPNTDMLAYWDTVADRLYKIRHCMNIQGQVQQLPLYEPPINPALLVRAAAAGVDVNSILNNITGSTIPNYRFTFILQKANEFCADVKALGSALLAALEKQDAEQLALLRSGLEYTLLQAMLDMKQRQMDEANANLDALNAQRDVVQARYNYYSSRQYMNSNETEYFNSLTTGLVLQALEGEFRLSASAASEIPQFHAQGLASGASFGGQQIATALNAVASQIGVLAGINATKGTMASTKGGYDRRMDDWQFQAQSAQLELTQIDKQIIATQIRIDIAQKDYDEQQIQIDNNRSVDDFLRSKFTSADLYSWMTAQIAATYFQAYQLAATYAKQAGQCYDFELPWASKPSAAFITLGYWDSLRKGLQAGEQMQYDLRRLEDAYLQNNSRHLELTKHVSLAFTAPELLAMLIKTGNCTINIPEELFDMDYPGHYNRIIKSVSISIPCVAGPYTTVPCTLVLNNSTVRTTPSTSSPFINPVSPCQKIATSSAQNDSGIFELNFRDERYLPFEGAGAISNWSITLGGVNNTGGTAPTQLYPFDFTTISDVIMHIKYTAVDGSSVADGSTSFGVSRSNHLSQNVTNALIGTGVTLQRYFSLKREFSNAWYAYAAAYPGSSSTTMNLPISSSMYPFFAQNLSITIAQPASGHSLYARLVFKTPPVPGAYPFVLSFNWGSGSASITISSSDSSTASATVAISSTPTTFALQLTSNGTLVNIDTLLSDIYLVTTYKLS